MKHDFYIRLQSTKQSGRKKAILIGIFCFILAMMLLIIVSRRFFWVFFLPLFWLIYLYRHLKGGSKSIIMAKCGMCFFDTTFTLEIASQMETVFYRIKYEDLEDLNIYQDGRVDIAFKRFIDSAGKICEKNKEISFYVNEEDGEMLKHELQKICDRKALV